MSAWWEKSSNGWDDKGTHEADAKWQTSDQQSWDAAWEADAKQAEDKWQTSDQQSWDPAWEADAKQAEDKWQANDQQWKQADDTWQQDAAVRPAPGLEEPASWGWNDSTSAGAEAAPAPSGKTFWETQEWNKENNVLPLKEEWELEQDDHNLFSERQGSYAGIDFSRYDDVPVETSGSKCDLIPVISTFKELYSEFDELIPTALKDNLVKIQYEKPTPVQKYAIPVGLVGRDVMCCAQTGSGKTAAFLIPIIGRMMKIHSEPTGLLDKPFEGKCSPDTLIMTPTRELCIQIHEEARKFCHRTLYRCCRVYGGEPPKVQMADLARGCDLMVACPGRLQDFIGRDIVAVDKVYILVLDEADRMLDMGFERAIRDIVENHGMHPRDERQTMMFSATFPDSCQTMAQDFLYDYIWIGCGIIGGAVDTVSQSLEKVNPTDKYGKLIDILDKFFSSRQDKERALVFVNAKDTAKWLDEQLWDKNFDTGCLHGNLTQEERESNLRKFRSGDVDVMVATDVAARGLDIEKVALVVNYDMPNELDTYVHRIGRSGRIGNRGQAVTFISTDDSGQAFEKIDVLKKLHSIMRDAKSEVPDWLEGAIDTSAADSYENSWSGWGGRDMRGSWEGHQ
jgi:ATP-dependent RNA helicase DDX3X